MILEETERRGKKHKGIRVAFCGQLRSACIVFILCFSNRETNLHSVLGVRLY